MASQCPDGFPWHLAWNVCETWQWDISGVVLFHSSPLDLQALVLFPFLFSRHAKHAFAQESFHPLHLPARDLFTRSEEGWFPAILPSVQTPPPLSLAILSKLTNSTTQLLPSCSLDITCYLITLFHFAHSIKHYITYLFFKNLFIAFLVGWIIKIP